MDMKLTNKVKDLAHRLGADLVGIADIGRFAKAPVKMSPQGILPSAKSVIVCAIHHPDACIQLGGESHPQEQGPYRIQGVMNNKLDYMAFRIARFLTKEGFRVVPIASSNIWRYREYDGLDAVFAPDMSHIYAATAAGLGELGWNGLTMTPEYGAWNRFISIITDAELIPTPLYSGPKLCDMCGECIRHCPTDAFRKEVNGVKMIEIEDKVYKFANKNLWRCAWGEHFDLDLDLDIPDVVNEEVILEYVKKYSFRGGEFGQCLKYCLPKQLRGEGLPVAAGSSFTSTYVRKTHTAASDLPVHRGLIDNLAGAADRYHADHIGFVGSEKLEAEGIPADKYLPGGKSAIVVGIELRIPEGETPAGHLLGHTIRNGNWSRKQAVEEYPTDSLANLYSTSMRNLLDFAVMDITGELEKNGYKAVAKTNADNVKYAMAAGIYNEETKPGIIKIYDTVITSAVLPTEKRLGMQEFAVKDINEGLAKHIDALGADTAAAVPSAITDGIVDRMRPLKDGEEILQVWDKNIRFSNFDPEVRKVSRKLFKAADYINGAKSIIMIGMHYPDASAERAGQPPAEAVGPYVFAQYEVRRQLSYAAHSTVKYLNSAGYKAMYTFDLMGMGSQIVTPRGYYADSKANSLAAAAAGIGGLTYSGMVYNEEFGINQIFVAVVTDAPLAAGILKAGKTCVTYPADGTTDLNKCDINKKVQQYCAECRKCITICPAAAFTEKKAIDIETNGMTLHYVPVETKRCDWSSKYALCGEDGVRYTGSKTNELPPADITKEALAAAAAKSDPVLKFRGVTAEKCIVRCPMASMERVVI